MSEYGASTYGERIAGVYDRWHPAVNPDMLATLADLAGSGPALELGIGTGRVALPLLERGVEVHGIDASPAMVAKLQEKPRGDRIPVTLGDFGAVAAEGEFSLAYIVFNTLFGLLTQEEQVACFRNVAARLKPAGLFVIEAFVPDPSRYDLHQRTHTSRVDADGVMLDVSVHDPVLQRVNTQHVLITGRGVELYPVQIRYAWPAELDLMAQLAGMRLRHRWSSWRREPLTAASTNHVSVYERVP
jgi:SAM-dependent methyltransferase